MYKKILSLNNICKSFGGVHALKNVSIDFYEGEIHALIGENGAGKSTLVKILASVIKPDQGEIRIYGNLMHFNSAIDAKVRGISTIYQELNNVPHLTVAENIFLGEAISLSHPLISRRKLDKQARDILRQIGFDIDPSSKMGSLSVAYQQMVEIAKAVSHNSKIIIFDEPTAVLTDKESSTLFDIIEALKYKGITIIYISHRMKEIFTLSDRITILKDGSIIGTYAKNEIDENSVISMMVGRELAELFPEKKTKHGNKVLELHNINSGEKVRNVSLYAREGEIVGLTGLVGAGKTETLKTIYGVTPSKNGKICVSGKDVRINSIKKAINYGILYLSEDRKNEGVIINLPIRDNISLPNLKIYSSLGFIDAKRERNSISSIVDFLKIKISDIRDDVSSLSGGNQQKVSLAKWLIRSGYKVLLLDEPTRGIDVGSKQEIYTIITQLACDGICIIIASSEIQEIIGICNRTYVMYEGEISGELIGDMINEENITKLAFRVEENVNEKQ